MLQSEWLVDYHLTADFSRLSNVNQLYYIPELKDKHLFNFVHEFISDLVKIHFLIFIMLNIGSYFCLISYAVG
jgi:hypothetical protein